MITKKKKSTRKADDKKREAKPQSEPRHMFSSRDEQIDYMYGSDPILCQALKNCCDE